jgi:hypothetical protein
VFNAHSRLQLTSFDLEVAKYSLLDQWTWNVGGGLRYVWMYQSYTAALSSADSFFNFVVASRKLNAFGPTMSGQVRHRLGASNCGFFAGGRGALLFGYQRQTVTATLNNLNSTNNMSDWSVMPFVQAECGFDYRLPLSTSTFVAETALLGQAWINAGNSSNTNATDGTATDATLGLFGIRSSVGLTY